MSFLLDALRKSEKQRRLGEAPNIHGATELESGAARNPGLSAVVLLVLVAFLVLTWFAWRRYAPPEVTVVVQQSQQLEPRINTGNMGSVDSSRMLPEIPRGPGNDGTQKPGRTAVERYSGPGGTGPGDRRELENANSESPAGDDSPLLSEAQLPTTTATTIAQEAEAMKGLSSMASTHVQDQEENEVHNDEVQNDEVQNIGQAFQPGLISYWQLPDSVRQQLPTFRISVIVFAKRPQDRFILLNGVRLIEGDEPQPDLVLREIRREGAVFSYRLYRFLVTQ